MKTILITIGVLGMLSALFCGIFSILMGQIAFSVLMFICFIALAYALHTFEVNGGFCEIRNAFRGFLIKIGLNPKQKQDLDCE